MTTKERPYVLEANTIVHPRAFMVNSKIADEGCVKHNDTKSKPNLAKPKVGKTTGLGDDIPTPKYIKTQTVQRDENTNFKPLFDNKSSSNNKRYASTERDSLEISAYQPPNDWGVTWFDVVPTKSFAGFPLPSAKVVASQAIEIAHWASAVNENFAEVVLKDIDSLNFNRTNLTLDTSPFAIACIQGDVATVQRAIEMVCSKLKPPYSKQDKLRLLLEAHESGSWSPLLLIACVMGEDKAKVHTPSLLTVAALLLQAGARPDVQDTLGKSIVHYIAGCDAKPVSMRLLDMCISASKSANLYGKDVVLEGLTTTSLNGRKGVVGGYDYWTNQRSVFVPSLSKEVWISVENIRLANAKEVEKNILLIDLQDHNGDTVLHEIMKSDHNEIANSLLYRYNASIHVKNNDGITPAIMTFSQATSSVSKMIYSFAELEAEKAWSIKTKRENVCASCSKSLGKGGMTCSNCVMTSYCSQKCQTRHWKQGGHRLECKQLATIARGVQHVDYEIAPSFGSADFVGDSYVKPFDTRVGEKFVVAVQTYPDTKSLMIFSVCDGCQFKYKSTGPGYAEVMEQVQKEAAWDGCKTYMKASFGFDGECTMYPATACVKKDYWW